ncbi:MAG: YtxH domain-containing protein [Fastidiosipilaceae bacterium]|jgi:gas vesicle protein
MLIQEIIGAFTGQNKRDKNRQVAAGTIIGFLVGASASLLLAPQSGKETREDISEAVGKGATFVKDKAEIAYDKTKSAAKTAGQTIGGWTGDVKDRLKEATSDEAKAARAVAREARVAAREAKRDIKQTVGDAVDNAEEVLDTAQEATEEITK